MTRIVPKSRPFPFLQDLLVKLQKHLVGFVNFASENKQYIKLKVIFVYVPVGVSILYTLSHSDNDHDVAEHVQGYNATRRILFVSSGNSFLNT